MNEQGPSRLKDFLISGVIAFLASPMLILLISVPTGDWPDCTGAECCQSTFCFGPAFLGFWLIFAIIGTIIFFIISLVIRAVQGPKNHSTSNPPNYQTPYQQPPPPSNKADSFKNLEQLAQLKDKGIISKEEFQVEKDRILNP
jgi:hypothetical protein